MPLQSGRAVVRRVVREVKDDNVPLLSAGVAFYSLMALFPAVLAVVSIYGLVASPADVTRQLQSFTQAIPSDAATLIVNQAKRVAGASNGGLGLGVIVGILASVWSASSGIKWLMSALTLAYDDKESRPWLKLRAQATLMTLVAAAAVTVSFGLTSGLPAVFREADMGGAGPTVASIARWPVLAVLILLGLEGVYRYGPDRPAPRWRWATWGSCLAALVWLLASLGFSLYTGLAGRFDQTYGALGGVVVLMLWLFLSSFAILLGAEINAEVERQVVIDSILAPDDERVVDDDDDFDVVDTGGPL